MGVQVWAHPAASNRRNPSFGECRLPAESPDVLCFSHLRWHFVTQRPQHLLARCARDRRVFYWEEPLHDGAGAGSVEILHERENLLVLRPHLPPGAVPIAEQDELQTALLNNFLAEFAIERYVCWYYTPMALGFTADLTPEATIYDCMDELSAFRGAPPELREREQQLFARADVVFTGGISLYEAKREQHSNVHAFPSSIDVRHFRQGGEDPEDQAGIPHPRAGFYGVLDERLDISLLAELARLRPACRFILIGPVVKIDAASLPQAPNLHYLGPKTYAELPVYLDAWDAALLPFARNESTRFISPTKTPEYLAAGKPVVSTPITDVVRGYEGLVAIADTPEAFAAALDKALEPPTSEWRAAVERKLDENSWDRTWIAMWAEVERVIKHPADPQAESKEALPPPI